MSASLVGSEMCIRDRPFQGRQELRRRRLPRTSPRHWLRLVGTRAARRACLLYTSDAADDM
eukprot:4459408-Alexandrium_andersonii.AAC.1